MSRAAFIRLPPPYTTPRPVRRDKQSGVGQARGGGIYKNYKNYDNSHILHEKLSQRRHHGRKEKWREIDPNSTQFDWIRPNSTKKQYPRGGSSTKGTIRVKAGQAQSR